MSSVAITKVNILIGETWNKQVDRFPMQCGYKFCKEKTGDGAKEIRDHNFIKDNG